MPSDSDHGRAALRRQTPAWLTSLIVHVIALLAMALVVSRPPSIKKARVITSTPVEDSEFVDDSIKDMEPVEIEATDAVDLVEAAVSADVAVELVVPVEAVEMADDLDAAPLAVEASEFGDSTALAANMLATIGAVGGQAGGFDGRANPARMAATGGGSAGSEAAVEAALKWFATHQRPDGSWTTQFDQCPSCEGRCRNPGNRPKTVDDPAGATALALLPFMGRGYTHVEGPYKRVVERGLAYLAGTVVANRGRAYELRNNHGGYVQALATIALCEAYAMSQDARLGGPAQLALNFIQESQDPVGGGWMYWPRQPGCTSVTAFTVMALKSGHMSYLQVKPLTIEKASAFLDSVASDSGSKYGYRDASPRDSLGPAGVLCRMYLGWPKTHPGIELAVKRFVTKGPDPQDMYYNYYATQVVHHYGDDSWAAWNPRMRDLLVETQAKDGHEAGSWHFTVDHRAGRHWITALSTLILEVYYRHLPIYREKSTTKPFQE